MVGWEGEGGECRGGAENVLGLAVVEGCGEVGGEEGGVGGGAGWDGSGRGREVVECG